jgi:hypothetical protein
VIPAGSVEGANGTFFRSDVVLINFGNRTQQIRLRWIPQAGTGESTVTITDIGANSGFRFEDFVRQVLGQRGIGAIVISAISGGEPDLTGLLYATSRIWSLQPGVAGQVSQSFDTLPLSSIQSTDTMAIFGLRRSSQFRVNAGIVNLDPVNTQTFQIVDPAPLA